SQVTDMSYMFNECSALTTIYVGSDWSTEAVTNGTDMFNKCTNLVGGAGTTYSADHTDYTYARIDGGPNSSTPGYLTGDGTQSSVAAPVFAFDGDNLSMTTETANASIFYKMEELPTMDETYVDSVSNSMIVTPDGQQSTYYERPFELKKSAIVKAIAVIDTQAGTIASDTTTLVYDYAAWQNLLTAIEKGSEIYELAKDNSSVETSLKEDLQWALYEGNMLYRERAMMNSFEANHFAERITELCNQIQSQMSATDEPYAVLSDNNTILTFYYDNQKTARGGLSVGPFDNSTVSWRSARSEIQTVVFDASFANCTSITSTAKWFSGFSSLDKIEGMENLKTDNVTNMSGMFAGCRVTNLDFSKLNTSNVTDMSMMFCEIKGDLSASLDLSSFNTSKVTNMSEMFVESPGLTSINLSGFDTSNVTDMDGMFAECSALTGLDLSSFNTANVTNMRSMFRSCTNLTTIYAGAGWSTASVTNSDRMFTGCANLVGGAGTAYSADHIDHTYARIDAEGTPGYFSAKNATPMEKVATPTFSWRNDELTMSCSTEGATIMYQMSDEDTNGDGVINDDDYKQYSAPIEVKRDVIIKAIATKEGMTTSDPITLDYPYEAWTRLYETCIIGQEILSRASRSSRVPQEMVDRGEAYIAYALDMYAKRTEDRDRVESVTQEIRVFLAEIEQMMQVPATYSNYVLTAEEDATMAEIADQYGSYYGNQVAAIVWNSSVPMTESDLQRFTSNPNLLIYAQSESMVPANRDNVVINGVAKNVVLTDTVSGNCNFYAPQEFTAEAIQYTRTFSQQTQIGVSRGWEAIALPFTVQTYTHADRGVIAPFGNSASENHFWLRELTQNGLQNAQTIEANKPYIISMPNSEEYRPETNLAGQVTFSALNAIVPVTEATPVEYGSISLVPAFQSRSAQTEIYALNVGEERNGYPEGSVFERDYRTVRPFEAYTLHRDNQNPAPQFIMIGGDMGNGTTGIEELVDKRMNTNDSWYTIDGRRLQGAPAGKGLYIRNGKKVIVR
ncbi:MAG: BspA family leucine-rich repeat surface protein, partial [Prevotella sp.]|nr:BspA family leucine-rich repeat surface protein [Prevotella sp.]